LGTIRYPGTKQTGILLYLQAAPLEGMNADTLSYWRRHVDFPNQTTADQFFDEEQLEAYRELGMAVTQATIRDLKAAADEPSVQQLKRTFGW
jgi:hypothetical protein